MLVIFASTALPRLRTGVGTVVELFLGVAVALPLLLGVACSSGFFALDGVCALLIGCPVEILLLFLAVLLALGVVNDLDLCTPLGVGGLSRCCSEFKLFFLRWVAVLLDLGVINDFDLCTPLGV